MISRAKWDWKPGEAEAARDALDPSMLDRFEDSVTQVVRRSLIYNRALVDKFGDHDAVREERTAFKVAVTHFEECIADLGLKDKDKAEKRFETLSIWMKENGIKDPNEQA